MLFLFLTNSIDWE